MVICFIAVLFVIFIVYSFCVFAFSQSEFWFDLTKKYACSRKEFKSIESTSGTLERFVYYRSGKWCSENSIEVKFSQDYMYIGSEFFLDFLIKPLKIPKDAIAEDGVMTYLFVKRKVLKIKGFDNVDRKIAVSYKNK